LQLGHGDSKGRSWVRGLRRPEPVAAQGYHAKRALLGAPAQPLSILARFFAGLGRNRRSSCPRRVRDVALHQDGQTERHTATTLAIDERKPSSVPNFALKLFSCIDSESLSDPIAQPMLQRCRSAHPHLTVGFSRWSRRDGTKTNSPARRYPM